MRLASKLILSTLNDIQTRSMIAKTAKAKSAVTVSQGFVQLGSSLIEQFSYEKITYITTDTKPNLIVCYGSTTVIWNVLSPDEHLAVFQLCLELTSCFLLADEGYFITGNRFGVVSIYELGIEWPIETFAIEEFDEILGVTVVSIGKKLKITALDANGKVACLEYEKTLELKNIHRILSKNQLIISCARSKSYFAISTNDKILILSPNFNVLETLTVVSSAQCIDLLEDHVLLAHHENLVTVIDVNDRKLVKEISFGEKYKISTSKFLGTTNSFISAIFDKDNGQFYLKTHNASGIDTDKMRYKVTDVVFIRGDVNFMVVATERTSDSSSGVKSVLKVHKVASEFN